MSNLQILYEKKLSFLSNSKESKETFNHKVRIKISNKT